VTRPSPIASRIGLVLARASGAAVGLAILLPGTVLGHQLNVTYTSRLPLAVYVAGAAITVALSFAFVILRDVRVELPTDTRPAGLPPAWLRYGLRAIGLFGWAWIMVQGIAGGSSSANVATLFLWVYGWVGVALVSALLFPIWHWLDPFSTLYDIGAALVRRLGITPWEPSEYPAGLGRWPAAIGFTFFIWLELGLDQGEPETLFIVLAGYTALTLAMMAQFGRDAWRANAEAFTVWFRLLGRLAPLGLADEDGRVRRRPFAAGLLEANWTVAEVTIVALGVGSILFDGLSQTQIFFQLFGFPEVPEKTVLLLGFLGIIVAAALLLVRVLGPNPSGAGLLPIAAGYLIAHYLTYLLIDGQLIVVALSDPFQRGWNIGLGMLFYEPSGAWLPPGLVWTLQLAAVVGGHMIGAWAGHASAVASAPPGTPARTIRMQQVPLAVVMVALTTLTLWSLGQDLVVTPEDGETAAMTVGRATCTGCM
jgi:hypothetical protein